MGGQPETQSARAGAQAVGGRDGNDHKVHPRGLHLRGGPRLRLSGSLHRQPNDVVIEDVQRRHYHGYWLPSGHLYICSRQRFLLQHDQGRHFLCLRRPTATAVFRRFEGEHPARISRRAAAGPGGCSVLSTDLPNKERRKANTADFVPPIITSVTSSAAAIHSSSPRRRSRPRTKAACVCTRGCASTSSPATCSSIELRVMCRQIEQHVS